MRKYIIPSTFPITDISDQFSPVGLPTGLQTVYHGAGGLNEAGDVHYNGKMLVAVPKAATGSYDDTHAAFVLATAMIPSSSYTVTWKFKRLAQLRQNLPPNNWEEPWLIMDKIEGKRATAIILKKTGVQVSRWDSAGPSGGEYFPFNDFKYPSDRWSPGMSDKVVTATRNGDSLRVEIPGLSMDINVSLPFAYLDGATAPMCQVGIYGEDCSFYCTGLAVSS